MRPEGFERVDRPLGGQAHGLWVEYFEVVAVHVPIEGRFPVRRFEFTALVHLPPVDTKAFQIVCHCADPE